MGVTVAFRFPDWVDWTGIGSVLLLLILAALVWILVARWAHVIIRCAQRPDLRTGRSARGSLYSSLGTSASPTPLTAR